MISNKIFSEASGRLIGACHSGHVAGLQPRRWWNSPAATDGCGRGLARLVEPTDYGVHLFAGQITEPGGQSLNKIKNIILYFFCKFLEKID